MMAAWRRDESRESLEAGETSWNHMARACSSEERSDRSRVGRGQRKRDPHRNYKGPE